MKLFREKEICFNISNICYLYMYTKVEIIIL